MRLWILCRTPPVVRDSAYLIGRLASRFGTTYVTHVPDSSITCPTPPHEVDVIWNRTLSVNPLFLSALDQVAGERGVPLINPGTPTLEACDKRTYPATYSGLTPLTWNASCKSDVLRIWRQQAGATLVLKYPFGKFGKEVELFCSENDISKIDRLLHLEPKAGLVVQEFCSGFVVGDKRVILHRQPSGEYVIAAWYRRVPPPGGWISNLSAGGRLEMCELDADEREFSMRVAHLSCLDYVGLDIGQDKNRLLLIETNAYTGGHIDFDMASDASNSGDEFAETVLAIAKAGPTNKGPALAAANTPFK